MKTLLVTPIFASLFLVHGCGDNSLNSQKGQVADEDTLSAEARLSESKRDDGCTIATETVSLSKSQGGEIKVSFNFLTKTAGDWIGLQRVTQKLRGKRPDFVYAWAHPSLAIGDPTDLRLAGVVDEAQQTWTLNAADLPTGVFMVKGYVNWYARTGTTDGYTASCIADGRINITD